MFCRGKIGERVAGIADADACAKNAVRAVKTVKDFIVMD